MQRFYRFFVQSNIQVVARIEFLKPKCSACAASHLLYKCNKKLASVSTSKSQRRTIYIYRRIFWLLTQRMIPSRCLATSRIPNGSKYTMQEAGGAGGRRCGRPAMREAGNAGGRQCGRPAMPETYNAGSSKCKMHAVSNKRRRIIIFEP